MKIFGREVPNPFRGKASFAEGRDIGEGMANLKSTTDLMVAVNTPPSGWRALLPATAFDKGVEQGMKKVLADRIGEPVSDVELKHDLAHYARLKGATGGSYQFENEMQKASFYKREVTAAQAEGLGEKAGKYRESLAEAGRYLAGKNYYAKRGMKALDKVEGAILREAARTPGLDKLTPGDLREARNVLKATSGVDWYADYSDDYTVRSRGKTEIYEAYTAVSKMAARGGPAAEAASVIFDKAIPKDYGSGGGPSGYVRPDDRAYSWDVKSLSAAASVNQAAKQVFAPAKPSWLDTVTVPAAKAAAKPATGMRI